MVLGEGLQGQDGSVDGYNYLITSLGTLHGPQAAGWGWGEVTGLQADFTLSFFPPYGFLCNWCMTSITRGSEAERRGFLAGCGAIAFVIHVYSAPRLCNAVMIFKEWEGHEH